VNTQHLVPKAGLQGFTAKLFAEEQPLQERFVSSFCPHLFPNQDVCSIVKEDVERCVGGLQCLKILKRFKLEVSLYTGLGDKKLQLPFNEVQPLSMSCFDMMLVDSPDILNLNLGEMMRDVFS